MSTDDDWRRDVARGTEGMSFTRRRYRAPRPGWDHDHRTACSGKVSEDVEGTLRVGWASVAEAARSEGHRWDCDTCFRDLAGTMGWRDGATDADMSEWEAT